MEGSFSLSNLLCQEDGSCLDQQGEEGRSLLCDDEYIEILVSREKSFKFEHDGYVVLKDEAKEWMNCARSNAVKWIVQMSQLHGFGFQTVWLAVTYLDRFIVRRIAEIRQDWAIQLLAVACLTIAVKLEECHVPKLLEMEVEGYKFDAKSVQRMELLVLTTLGWRMRNVTPLPYLSYLGITFGCGIQSEEATDLVLSAVEGVTSLDHLPSVISVAAFSVASGLELSNEVLASVKALNLLLGNSDYKQVHSCYVMFQRIHKEKKKRGEVFISNGSPPFACEKIDISTNEFKKINNLIRISDKRRRLALSGYRCNCLISNNTDTDELK